MTLHSILLLVGGFLLLMLGAELLVRGASRLAETAGISRLVVGLTVVAFGTSAPEITVSVTSALHHQADLSVGNVLGSNTFNTLLILGVSSMITPLVVHWQLVRMDVPIMVVSGAVLWLLASDGSLGHLDGAILFAGLVVYVARTVYVSRREERIERESLVAEGLAKDKAPVTPQRIIVDVLLISVGLGLLVFGADWMVDGAVGLARVLGVSELVIGLTIVAAGTGMPELATSVVAAYRKERDIAVGNVVGSNMFNMLAVLGLTGIVAPGGLAVSKQALAIDMPVMFAALVLCLPIFAGGLRITRPEGVLMFSYYVAYVTYLVMHAASNGALATYRTLLLILVPATLLVVLVAALRTILFSKNRGRMSDAPAAPDG